MSEETLDSDTKETNSSVVYSAIQGDVDIF